MNSSKIDETQEINEQIIVTVNSKGDTNGIEVGAEDTNPNPTDTNIDTATAAMTKSLSASRALNSWPEDIDRDATGCGLGRWACRVYNNWTYSYMNTVLQKGAAANKTLRNKKSNKIDDDNESTDESDNDEDGKIHLTSDDLYPVPRQMKSNRLVRNFESEWQRRNIETSNSNAQTGSDDETERHKATQRLLFKSLWKVAAPTFVPAGIFQLVATVVISCMPLVVRRLLVILEEGVDVVNQGLRWSVLLTLMTLVNGLATQRYRHQSIKTGVALRSAMVNIIYKHVLMLSPAGKKGLTSGLTRRN